MTDELVEHAARILRFEPTRTLGARALHLRTSTALGVIISYARFLELLTARPDQFAIIHDRSWADGWSAPERSSYAAALDRAGFVRGPTVVLAAPARPDDPRIDANELAASFGAALADAHAAVLELFELNAATGGGSAAIGDAAVQLEELRIAYAAQLRRGRR